MAVTDACFTGKYHILVPGHLSIAEARIRTHPFNPVSPMSYHGHSKDKGKGIVNVHAQGNRLQSNSKVSKYQIGAARYSHLG